MSITAVVVLAAVLLVWTEIEAWGRQNEMERLVVSEGGALVEALVHAVEHALVMGREVEELASARLLDVALLLDRLHAAGALDRRALDDLVERLGLHHVLLFDGSRRRVLESVADDGTGSSHAIPYLPSLGPLFDGRADELILGTREFPQEGRIWYAVAVRTSAGGALLVVMDAEAMLAFERRIGPADLIRIVAHAQGIAYAVIEDAAGNEVAGAGPRGAPGGDEVLEIERPLLLRGGRTGRLRVGLEANTLRAAAAAGRRRAAAAAAVALAMATFAVGVVLLRRHAAALRGETARARSLTDAVLEGISDAVIVLDRQGIVRLANPAACGLFRRPGEDLVGKDSRDAGCEEIAEMLAPDSPPRELEVHPPGASPVRVLAAVSPVLDADGSVTGSAILLRDLTEIHRLEREARRTESLAAFGRLAASVAHEVRNPLNAVAVGVQRIEREFAPTDARAEDHRRLSGLLRSEIERLDGIVGRFLDLARPPRVEPRPGDLAAEVREAASLVAGSLPAGIRLRVDADGVVPAVFDPRAVRQVLLNLARNAVEALGTAGTISLACRTQDRQARVEVADDGPGIPEADLDNVFEFGFSTKPSGNGLGLPIVHRLIAEMGGTVMIRSSPAKGTRVILTLPSAEGTSARRA